MVQLSFVEKTARDIIEHADCDFDKALDEVLVEIENEIVSLSENPNIEFDCGAKVN